MLKRKLSTREIILVAIAFILVLGIFYYEVILKGYNNAKATYDTTSLEDQQTILVAKATKLKQMEEYIEKHANDKYGTVSTYNNLSNEIDALANILNGCDNVSITWNEPELTDNIVRRSATVSFETSSYANAESIMQQINELEYKCIITSTALSDTETTSISSSATISVELQITFFETTDGASNTSGLVVEDTSLADTTTTE